MTNITNEKITHETSDIGDIYGDYVKLPIKADANTIKAAKEELAKQAGVMVEKAIMENDSFIIKKFDDEYIEKCRQFKKDLDAFMAGDRFAMRNWVGFSAIPVDGTTEPFMTIGYKVCIMPESGM